MNGLQALAVSPDTLLGAIAWIYLFTNAVRILSYLPQITVVWRCNDGARSLSLWTWGMWTVSHVSALLYGVLVMHDTFFVVISLINLIGCGAVTLIAGRRRLDARRAVMAMSRAPRHVLHE